MMDRRLAGLPRDPFSPRPRFYPPGQHPATHRMRQHRDQLVRLPSSPIRDEALAYVDAKLAAFEEQESEEKQRMLHVLERE